MTGIDRGLLFAATYDRSGHVSGSALCQRARYGKPHSPGGSISGETESW